jgi:FecR protein
MPICKPVRRRASLAFVLLLLIVTLRLPSILPTQRTIKVASVYGPVEHKTLLATTFVPLSAVFVNVGDRVRTGPGATLTLELPGGAFMIVDENSMLTVPELGAPNVRNLIHVMMGKVRFYIQRPGGKANPHGTGTATALIAVRG